MVNRLINPETLGAWKSHPETQEFLRFLRDRQMVLMEQWSRGSAADQSEAVFLGKILNLSSEHVADFYNIEVEQ